MPDNKKIAKNSLYMAVRMLISMSISLYTSRVVLQQLGVIDFGIYSVVAGLSMLVAFINSSLTYAIQRYLNVELGLTGGKNMQSIFSACCLCLLLCSGLILILAETGGLWFLNHELDIPPGRMGDARLVFQLSLLIVIFELLRVPFQALITAYEKMQFYAYNSILEAALKLSVAICLTIFAGDKLIIYMGLLIAVAVIITGAYFVYCRVNFPGIHFSVKSPISNAIEIGRFLSLNLLTSIGDLSYMQGFPMVVNILFGVAYNATMGIANQVKTAVYSFTKSVQVASSPQLIQLFSAGNHDQFERLFIQTSRLSFYIVLFIGMPIMLNMPFLLDLWLVNIPPDACSFARLMIVFCICDSLTGPLWVSMQAYGRIAVYQLVTCLVWVTCIPIAFLTCKYGGLAPAYSLVVIIGVDIAVTAVRVVYNSRCCHIAVSTYLRQIVLRLLAVVVVSVPPAMIVAGMIDNETARFFISSTVSCIATALAVLYLGISPSERAVIIGRLKHKAGGKRNL